MSPPAASITARLREHLAANPLDLVKPHDQLGLDFPESVIPQPESLQGLALSLRFHHGSGAGIHARPGRSHHAALPLELFDSRIHQSGVDGRDGSNVLSSDRRADDCQ